MTGYRELSKNRDFTILWTGQTISDLGSQVSLFAFPLVTYALTGSALWAAVVEAAFLIGLCGALLPAGVLADRVDRKLLMRAASGGGALLYASLAVAGLLGTLTIPHLVAVGLLTGVATGLSGPAEMSAVRSVVPRELLPTAFSQSQARQHVGALLGGPLGGVLYGVTRWLPFAFDAVTFAAYWLLAGRLRTDLSAPADQPRRSPRQDIAEGFRFVLSWPYFRALIVWSASINLLVNAMFFVALLRLVQEGFDPKAIGLVSTAAGVSGILGALAAPWIIDRMATGALLVTVAWSFVPIVVPMVLWNNPAVVAAALAFGLFLNPAGNAGGQTYRIAHTPSELQGRAASASSFMSTSVMWLAPLLGGVLLETVGGPAAVAVIGGLVALVALVPTLSTSIRSVPRPAVWQAELAGRDAVRDERAVSTAV
ncbi:MFS transporter [Nocardioides agariphilus]|uniref:MFS transporter n=1 Tax=Nocardioides agariphilus TaxID=433664 RepID=A0A930VN58_9ACTN|nr:MFS transporter [Nocardioides agariphilus]MBF4768676.1 MFS transporter [Nocardioides agariphilus]